MLLTREALEAIFTKEMVEQSAYTTREGNYIRLINTKPELATVPALYYNIKKYRAHLSKFDNVPALFRTDYKAGKATGNKKMDLYLNALIPQDQLNVLLPPLDNNNSK